MLDESPANLQQQESTSTKLRHDLIDNNGIGEPVLSVSKKYNFLQFFVHY